SAARLLRAAGERTGHAAALAAGAEIAAARDRPDAAPPAADELEQLRPQADAGLRARGRGAPARARLAGGSPAAALLHAEQALTLAPPGDAALLRLARARRLHALAWCGRAGETLAEGIPMLASARGVVAAELTLALAVADLALGDHDA